MELTLKRIAEALEELVDVNRAIMEGNDEWLDYLKWRDVRQNPDLANYGRGDLEAISDKSQDD